MSQRAINTINRNPILSNITGADNGYARLGTLLRSRRWLLLPARPTLRTLLSLLRLPSLLKLLLL